MFYKILMSIMIVGDGVWWIHVDRRLRGKRLGTPLRTAAALFVLLLLSYVTRILLTPFWARHDSSLIDVIGMSAAYLWHLIVLPVTFLSMGIAALVARLTRVFRPAQPPQDVHGLSATVPTTTPSRRDVLSAATLVLPPLMAVGGVGVAMGELGRFRVRQMTIPLKSLPPTLDGLTIVHVSDTHIGRFTNDAMLRDVVEQTNALEADLTLFTGDLIDVSLGDLPVAVEFARKLRGRFGVFFCEGNHDLIQDVTEHTTIFRDTTRAAGLSMLFDEAQTLTIRGQSVQLLGASWNRNSAERKAKSAVLMRQIDPAAFQILLTHHPHVWDHTAVPLTLSGHTHGGQLMLTERVGVGPVMFRYWTGLYRRGDAALVVSNGVGNWFPVRTHAAAEIIHITLKSSR